MKKAFLMIEMAVVLIGISMLIQILEFAFSTIDDRISYEFMTVNARCEVVCVLNKRMP